MRASRTTTSSVTVLHSWAGSWDGSTRRLTTTTNHPAPIPGGRRAPMVVPVVDVTTQGSNGAAASCTGVPERSTGHPAARAEGVRDGLRDSHTVTRYGRGRKPGWQPYGRGEVAAATTHM